MIRHLFISKIKRLLLDVSVKLAEWIFGSFHQCEFNVVGALIFLIFENINSDADSCRFIILTCPLLFELDLVFGGIYGWLDSLLIKVFKKSMFDIIWIYSRFELSSLFEYFLVRFNLFRWFFQFFFTWLCLSTTSSSDENILCPFLFFSFLSFSLSFKGILQNLFPLFEFCHYFIIGWDIILCIPRV